MFRKALIFLFLLTMFSILSCSDDPSLTGTWDCTLTLLSGISSANLQLTENSGQLTGKFKWNDLNLPLGGTVNANRQVNMETQDSTHRCIFALRSLRDDTFLDGGFQYYKNNFWVDGGAFDATKR